jgi:hypothetical protein
VTLSTVNKRLVCTHIKMNVLHVLRAAEVALESAFRRLELRLQQIVSCVQNASLATECLTHSTFSIVLTFYCALYFISSDAGAHFRSLYLIFQYGAFVLAPSSQLSFTLWCTRF